MGSRQRGLDKLSPLSEVQRLSRLLDAIPAALYVTDAEGRLTYFNQAACTLSGRTPELGTDKWCVSWRLYHSDGTPMAHDECPMAVALKEGRAVTGAEAIAERPDGTRVPFAPYPAPLLDDTGKVVGGINVLVDIADRKRLEKTLAENEQRFGRMVALMPVGVYTCEAPSGRITFFNERAAELWGRRPALGESNERFCGSFKLWLPDGTPLPHDKTPMAMCLREGKAYSNEEVVVERTDGTRISILVNIDAVRNDKGDIVGAVNVFQDVTPLKEAERAVARRTEQLSTFMETAPVGMHRVGPDGSIEWANRAELQMMGYRAEEYVGHLIQEFHADQPVIEDILGRLTRGETLHDYEARVRCKDGSIKTVLIDSNVVWEEGRFLHTQCVTRDITERKRIEELQAGLAAIVDSSNDAIISKTLDGVITSWNRSAERIFGYTADEAIGRPIMLIVPPDRREEEENVLARLRRGERLEHFETERQAKDGRRVHVSLTVSPLRDATGQIVGASKIARDITERKRAEAAAREADRRKDEFLAMLAHELRNPLAPLRTGLHLLKLRRQDERAVGRTLDLMGRQVTQLVRLIDDLLDASRIATGKLELKLERQALRPILDTAMEMVDPVAKAKGQEILITLPGDRVSLHGDAARLAQLFSNLLNNASKYSADGSLIQVVARRGNGEVIVSVEDHGVGIPPDALQRIFEPFYQLNRTHDATESGLGVGLTLVKRIAELHGGSVRAFSDGAGKGSRFVVRLPTIEEAETPDAGDSIPSLEGVRRRILVVDDNRDAVECLAQLLEILGHEVHCAHDGDSAVRAATTLEPDVILLDIGLPGRDGYDVCRALREALDPPPFIVALTGWGQEKDRQRAREAGFDAHIVKPADLDALARTLDQAAALRAIAPAGKA